MKKPLNGGEDIIIVMLLEKQKTDGLSFCEVLRLYDKKPFLKMCKEKVLCSYAVLPKFLKYAQNG